MTVDADYPRSLYEVRMDICFKAKVHALHERLYVRLDKGVKATELIASSGAFYAVTAGYTGTTKVCALIVTTFVLLSLVYDFGGRAREMRASGQIQQATPRCHHCFTRGARMPTKHSRGFGRAEQTAAAQVRHQCGHVRVGSDFAEERVRHRFCGCSICGFSKRLSQERCDVAHPEEVRTCDPALDHCCRAAQYAHVQVGQIPHIDNGESQPGGECHLPKQHLTHEFQAGTGVAAQHGPLDEGRKYRRDARSARMVAGKLPCCQFGQGLGTGVRVYPVRLESCNRSSTGSPRWGAVC